jgi:hypothetical protein
LPKDFVAMSLKYSQEQSGKVPMVIKYYLTFGGVPESRVIIHPNPG